MIKIYIIGLVILGIAIILNGLAAKIGILSWYDYLKLIMDKNDSTPIRWFDYAWLYMIYPFLLGVAYKLGDYMYKLINKFLPCLILLALLQNTTELQAQKKREFITIANTAISNLTFSYEQIIKKAKNDTSYLVSIVMTDVHPVTSKLLSFGGKTREFSFFTEKSLNTYQEQLKKALIAIDTKSKKPFLASGNNASLETEFDKENNRYRLKMTWNTMGTMESRYTYLYLEDVYKMIEWISTINFGKTDLLPVTSPAISTKLTDEIALAPPIEKQYKSESQQSGSNSTELAKITGKWYNLVIRNEFKNGGIESGSTGDYEPIRINLDGTWSYYGKRGKISIVPFSTLDVLEWKMTKEIPKWKLVFHDFSNGDGVGYFTTDAIGNAVYVIVKFKIYSPREGYSIWTQYRKS